MSENLEFQTYFRLLSKIVCKDFIKFEYTNFQNIRFQESVLNSQNWRNSLYTFLEKLNFMKHKNKYNQTFFIKSVTALKEMHSFIVSWIIVYSAEEVPIIVLQRKY